MTVDQAAEKWGYSTTAIIKRCKDGRIAGAKKVERLDCAKLRWFIPDDTERPTDVTLPRGRHANGDYVRLKKDGMEDPVGYVWLNQSCATIGQLAEKLGVSMQRIKELYEEGFRRYIHEEVAANE